MPEHLFPGVFVEEAASGTHAIAGVPTATTAFLGVTAFGPVEAPRTVGSFAEYEAQFGGLSTDMPLGYAVQHYFLNGGREAVIARVVPSGARNARSRVPHARNGPAPRRPLLLRAPPSRRRSDEHAGA